MHHLTEADKSKVASLVTGDLEVYYIPHLNLKEFMSEFNTWRATTFFYMFVTSIFRDKKYYQITIQEYGSYPFCKNQLKELEKDMRKG